MKIAEKEKMEKELRNSQESYEMLTESISDVFFAMDKDLKYIYWNKASETLTGISSKDAIGKTIFDIFPDNEGTKSAAAAYQKVIKTQHPQVFINEYHLGGKTYFFEIHAYPFRGGISVFVKDITEHKKTQEALQKSEQKFKDLIETTTDWVWEVDRNGVYTYTSPKIKELLGYEPQEIMGKTPFDLMPPQEAQRVATIFRKIRDAHQPIVNLENTNQHKDGRLVILETSGIPIFDLSGSFIGYRGIDRDITGRKQTEEKLKIKDAAIASSINAIAICDLQGNMEYANNSLITMWGYKNAKEILGKNATEFWQFGKDAEDVIKEEKEKGGWTGELKAKKKDGSFFDVQISASLIKDENGNSVKLMGAFLDITERKHAQDEIVKARDYADNIIKSMFDTLIVINPDGKIRSINKTTAVLLGYKEEELIGKPFGTIVAEEEEEEEEEEEGIPFIGTRLKKLIKEGFIKEYDMTYKTKSGEMIPVSFSGAVMRDKDGKLIGIVCIGRDLRERKKAEDALRESEVRYKALFANAAEGIVAADLETMQFRYANPAICRMFGYTEEELVRLGVADIHPKESLDHVLAEFEAQARGKKTLASELPCLRKDGTLFYANVSATPIVLGGRKCNVGFFTDITERKKAEDALKKSEKELREGKLLLEQKNLALKEMVEHIERTKNKTKEDMAINVDETLMPIVGKLKKNGASPKYIKLLQYHLKELSSSFGRKITQRSTRLTSREIEICNMIKGGLTSKDISELLNVSHQTIEKHRKNIRKKLNLSNKKINLTSHLQKI